MKKFKILFIIIALVLVSVIAISCVKKQKENNTNSNLSKDENVLALGIMTSSSVLSDSSKLNVSGTTKFSNRMNLSGTTEEVIDMDKVNSYLQMMEGLLADEGAISVETLESDRVEYEFMMKFTVKDLAGGSSSYIVYFSQTLISDEFDDDFDDDDDFEDLGKHGNGKGEGHKHGKPNFDDEVEYLIEGIAIIDGTEYVLRGEKEEENNENELELVIKLDEKNYVIIEQELENNEIEYKYQVIKDGRKSLSLSFEIEDGSEYEIKFTTTENGVKTTYYFEKDTKNNTIKIKYHSNGEVYHIFAKGYVSEETGEIVYQYKVSESEKVYHYQKNHKHCDK